MSTAVVSGEHRHGMAIEVCESVPAAGQVQLSMATNSGVSTPAEYPAGREFGIELERGFRRFRRASYLATKRMMDIVISATLLVLLSPFFGLLAFLIYRDDKGAVFFTQPRVGKNGDEFPFHKFRSMVPNAQAMQEELQKKSRHADDRTFKIPDDPRITRIGKVIRRCSLDELPQLFNVLKGDMSLVGPRPALPKEVAKYDASDRRRLAVKPGITCIWQVSGRSKIPFPQQVEMDVEYIKNQSLLLDMKLMLQTIPAVLRCEGAE